MYRSWNDSFGIRYNILFISKILRNNCEGEWVMTVSEQKCEYLDCCGKKWCDNMKYCFGDKKMICEECKENHKKV